MRVPFSGVLGTSFQARFKPDFATTFPLIDKTEFDSYLGGLTFQVTDTGLSGKLWQGEGLTSENLANFAGGSEPYHGSNPVPTALVGSYNVAILTKEQNPPLALEQYPQGDGFLRVVVGGSGSVSASGMLADGTAFSCSNKLRADGTAPLFAPLYRKLGVIGGDVSFSPLDDSDVTGTDFAWVRPGVRAARYYPAGWETAIAVDVLGAKYAGRPDIGQGSANSVSGNTRVTFTAGLSGNQNLGATVSLDPVTGAMKLLPAGGFTYTMSVNASSGLFSGSFEQAGVSNAFRGILLNKGQTRGGFGYYLSPPPAIYRAAGRSGGVSLQSARP